MKRFFGVPPNLERFVSANRDRSVAAVSIAIILGSLVAPIVGAFADGAVRDQDFLISMLRRDLANLVAAIPAIMMLHLAARTRAMRPVNMTYLVWSSLLAILTFGLFRFVMQVNLGILSLDAGSPFLLPELARLPIFFLYTIGIRWLVMQRDQLVQVQRVLASEAQHAMAENNEALRSRVFDHLHGTVTSELVVARVRVNDIAREVQDPSVAKRLHDIADHIRHIHELEVRQLAHSMVASGLETSLAEALHELSASCEDLCAVSIDISSSFTELDRNLNPDERARVRLSAYRIVEECLSNALQHASADQVDVSVDAERKSGRTIIWIEVSSNGRIPVTIPAPGVGLRTMRARAAGHDGGVATSISGELFVVKAHLYVGD